MRSAGERQGARRVILAGGLIVLLSMGTRQSFGLFLAPASESLGIGRESFSLAVAVQNILLGVPVAGLLADRIGPRRVTLGGGLLFALALALLSAVASQGALFVGLGLLAGVALSATSYAVVLGAVAQVVTPERQGRSFGLITALGSVGMFAIVPLAQRLLDGLGWQGGFGGLAGVVAMITLLALLLPDGAPREDEATGTPPPLRGVLRAARGHSGFLLLNGGFFVCGFHVAFVATHLPAYLADGGLPGSVSASALALIGLFNVVGSYLFGRLGDRYRRKFLLSLLYAGRTLLFTLFLLVPLSRGSALLFGAAIGFLWLATVPLTSGTVAQIFGSRYLSTLYGIVTFSHQIGAFLGVWLGGRLFDRTGSYQGVWMTAIALGLLATLLHLPISDGRIDLRRRLPLVGT